MKRQILIGSLILLFIQTLATAGVLYVPSRDYQTIQSAINDAVNGDVVVVAPGTWTGYGNVDLDFGGKAITVRSEINPDNPEPGIIAATIIDCDGGRYGPSDIDPLFDPMFPQDTWKKFPHRAFYFHNGEGPNSKVLGFTIINGYQRGPIGDPGVYGYIGDPFDLFDPLEPDEPSSPPRAHPGADATGNGYGGAILCESASSPTIQYCVIKDCTVTGAQGGDGGRGMDGPWGHWTIPDFNEATGILDPNAEPTESTDGQWGSWGGTGNGNGYGGAIACRAGSSPIISDCTIKDNFARGGCGGNGGNGGNAAEYPDYDEGLESGSGDAGMSIGDGIGGGIYCDDGSSPTVTNCTFSNNSATTGVRGTGGQRGLGNTYEEPPQPLDGLDGYVESDGGIAGGAAYYAYHIPPSTANFINCTFTENKAYEAYGFYFPSPGGDISRYTVGGALYSEGWNTVTLDNCKFVGNLGGAVYCDISCNLNFDDCLFTGNSETANGGALYISPNCNVDLQGCIFGGNSAYDDGGALKCESNATLTNCSFGNNVADGDNDDWGYGGAMDLYLSGTTLIIDVNACSFSGNQSIYGGGFSSENFDATFTNCYFIGNTAQEGGGLDLVNGDVSVTGGAVKGNNATDGDGSGFNCRYTITEIRDCTISDNFADGIYPTGGNAGAINFYGGAATQTVFNCLITGNSATIDGGAIFCHNATPEIGNCTFSDNLAGGYGGAIFSDWASDPQITDSIFQNNNSHAIYEQNFGGNAIVTYSLFYDNPDGDYYDSGTGLTYTGAGEIGSIPGGSNNLYGDPLFLSGPLGGFYLRQQPVQPLPQSPAVDTGSTYANDPNIGLDTYTTRTDSANDVSLVDRGYHYIDIADVDTFQLTASVIGGQGTIEPETGSYYAGTVVTLTATPDAGWRVKAWGGTDDDSSTAETSSVVMNSDRTVTVEFDRPRTFIVAVGGGEGFYSNITDALHDAEDGDTIVVYAGIYYGPQVQVNKDVEIKSLRPDDPCCVAATIIDSTGHAGPVFLFDPARGPGCILNGFTIQNSDWFTVVSDDGDDPGENGEDGYPSEGGAIYIYAGAGPVIKNCVIQDNKILGGFGGDGAGADETHNAGRGGWGAWARGGAIYCGTNSSPAFINCQIINNQAVGGLGGDGGDWDPEGGWANYGGNWSRAEWWNRPGDSIVLEWVQGDLWEVWQTTIIALDGTYIVGLGYIGDYRWYSGYGGGVYCDTGSTVTFIDCTISGNLAQGGLSGLGGDEPGAGPMRAKPFPRKYEIPSFGGGVYCAADTTVTFNGCTITDNIASDPSYDHTLDAENLEEEDRIEDEYEPNDPYSIDPYLGHGGGVCAEDTATVEFTNCTFSENEAAVGGGIHFADANPIISDCNFTFNSAFHGGGLFGDLGQATIIGCDIINNEAVSPPNDPNVILGSGGGLHLWATEADIIDCNIRSNQAEASGGGAFFGGEGTPSLTNCLITNNTAGRDGGGVSTNIFSQLTISNCTIADNTVTGVGFGTGYGGGLYCSYESNTDIIDSIIWGNIATGDGWQVAIGTGFEYDPAPSTVDIYYSDIGPPATLEDVPEPEPGVSDYFIYSTLDTSSDHNTPGTYGLYGWVGSDRINRIIHYNGSTAYIHTVTIPDGAESHAHPNNPYSTGPIAPRTFTLERTFDLEVTLSHQSEFHVDAANNEIYVGAEEGIRGYVFDPGAANPVGGGPAGNYIFDSQIAPAAPFDGGYYTQTLAYDPDNDIWYAGAIAWNIEPGVTEREMYMYDGAQGPNDTWELAFTYTTEEGIDPMCHHDGMEFVNGYLFLADYTGEYIKQYTLGGALVNTYYHPPLSHELEGMGFGALEHFWVGSHGNTITEFGGGALQIGIYAFGTPIYVEDGCILNGETIYDWDPNDFTWDPNSHNIMEDPNFIAGYYLSQIAAGQLFDSPCVDAGSDLSANLGLDTYTTRTDGVPDGNVQPLVEYLFDTDASDTSGYGYHGILGGDAVVSGGVLTMSGAGYMDLPALFGAVNPFDGSGYFTIQMDFKTTGPAILISSSKEFPANTSSWDNAMGIYIAEVEQPNEVIYDNCWVGWMGSGAPPVTDGQWHLMVTTYDAETLVHHLYVDGVPESWAEPEDAAWDPNIPNIAEDTVRIGSTYNPDVYASGGSDFIGDIDNVRIIPDDSVIVDMGYHYRHGVTYYQLTVSVVDGNGTVEPDGGMFYENRVVELTADPCDGYRVKAWNGTDGVPFLDPDDRNHNTVTMTEDKIVTVEFELIPMFRLTTSVIGGNGTIVPNHPSPGVLYFDGTEIPLFATPETDYEVYAWNGTDNDSSRELTNTVTISGSDAHVTVKFKPIGEGDIYILRAPNTFYATIQDAIDAAQAFDEVVISDGLYSGSGNYDLHFNGIPVTVRSENGPENCIIDCNRVGRGFIFGAVALDPTGILDINSIEDPNYIVRGLTIQNGSADFGGGLYYESFTFEAGAAAVFIPAPLVENCIIRNCNATSGGGVAFNTVVVTEDPNIEVPAEPPMPVINNCKITGNRTSFGYGANGGGIFCTGGIAPIITTTEVSYNSGYFGGGIYCEAGSAAEIINCLIIYNSSVDIGGSIYLFGSDAIINLCTIMYNRGLDYGDLAPLPNPKGGVCARDSSPTITNCIIGRSGSTNPDYGTWGDGFTYGDDLYECEATFSCIENADEGEGNISDNPLFTTGGLGDFYLPQVQSGQGIDSPCINTGEQYVLATLQGPPPDGYNLGFVTTSVINNIDIGYTDMGFHYPFYDGPPVEYRLVINVTGEGYVEYEILGTDITGDVNSASSPIYFDLLPGTLVRFDAFTDPSRWGYWSGSDDDTSFNTYNYVTMSDHKTLTVSFELIVHDKLYVPEEYPLLQSAIDAAKFGDTIILAPTGSDNPYRISMGYVIQNKKAITITSEYPDDPSCVAATVIEMQPPDVGGWVNTAFIFRNVDERTVLDGITIRGFTLEGGDGIDGQAAGAPGSNGANVYGGAIRCEVNASPIIRNCIITNCSVTGGNGGNGAGGTAQGGHGGWPGRGYGGGMACLYNSHPVVINCTFENCTAVGGSGGNGGDAAPDGGKGGRGGAWFYGENSYWYNVPWPYADHGYYPTIGFGDGFYDFYTEYTGRGGALFVGEGCRPTFTDCTFTNNQTEGGTCGICGLDQPAGNRDQPGLSWEIDNFGGAVYCDANSLVKFENCTFNDNVADTNKPTLDPDDPDSYGNDDDFVGFGGAVAFKYNADVTFDDCTFNGNLGDIGGAMYWAHSDPLISECEFTLNSASSGGGILFVGGSGEIVRSSFSENEATGQFGHGGGICSLGSNAGIFDCNISNNDSNGSGGGIYISSRDIDGDDLGWSNLLVENCLIVENSAGRDGGGISANWGSEPNIVNCTIADNTVTGAGFDTGYGGGLYSCYGNYTYIIDSILWGNSAENGQQIAIGTSYSPATVEVSYSDVQGGPTAVWVDDVNCTLVWDDPTNINANPLFVTGPLGDYYLSQTDANSASYPGQDTDSPCVDAGSDYASHFGMNRYTTRTDNGFDKGKVDMGYHYPLPEMAQPCRLCDLVFDGIINFRDFAIFALNWLEEGCSDANDWCQGADLTFDTYVDFEDLAFFVECWLEEDTTVPEPDPSEWEIEPYSMSTTSPYLISMTAKTAVDAWGWDVEYYFQRTDANGSPDGNFRGWDPNSTYIDDGDGLGLDPNTKYGYRVKAHDELSNETEWSVIRYAITGKAGEVGAAEPPTWETEPYATSPNSIEMVATTSDPGGIEYEEYYFDETSGNPGGSDSGWQNEPNYTDTGLDPNTTYTYRVQAIDENGKTTDWSDPYSATTFPEGVVEDTTAPTPNPMQWAAGGEPEEIWGGPGDQYYADMTAVVATDPSGVEYNFICTTVPGHSSGWQPSNTYTKSVGLPGQALMFYVIARDLSPIQNTTGPSPTVAAIPRP